MTVQRYSYILMLLSTLVSTTPVADLSAQLPGSKAGDNRCQFSEMFRQDGWKIPGALGAVPKGTRLALSTSPGGAVPGVFVTEMEAGKSLSNLLMPTCWPDLSGRLIIRETPVRALQMSRVDYEGRVFAYVVCYEPQSKEDGSPRRTLGFVQVVFLDVDGSGSFTVMRYDYRGLFLASPDVPEWAKGQPQKPPSK
jgi:hypothetical protein